MDNPNILNYIADHIKSKIIKIELILYVFEGEVDSSDCFLQITLDNGNKFYLQGASNGETLELVREEWIDPFSPPLTKENLEYVKNAGNGVFLIKQMKSLSSH